MLLLLHLLLSPLPLHANEPPAAAADSCSSSSKDGKYAAPGFGIAKLI
jgi:hypothetical protein